MTSYEIMVKLNRLASHNPRDLAGMARFGIKIDKAWVISIPKLRTLAKVLKKEPNRHQLAQELWDSEIHEARILAGLIDDPKEATEEQVESWVRGFDSWDLCDQVCGNFFDKTKFAYQKAEEWSAREEEFVKRAGFVLMANLSVHDKLASDKPFSAFLKIIQREATDDRNFVRKAVNWALRQISKSRNADLYYEGLKTAHKISRIDNKTACWIASDAIRELEKDYIKQRFHSK